MKRRHNLHAQPPAGHRARHVGLARVLSKLGYCSRSQAAEFIRAGRVSLNGTIRHDPEAPVNMETDTVTIDAQPLRQPAFVYFMLNKPRGLITTASDEKGRPTIYHRLPPGLPWLSPVGRLDKASEGLLLLTNDTEWAGRITDPESHLDKTYHVQIEAPAEPKFLDHLLDGVMSDGELLRAKRARIIRGAKRNVWIEIVLDEGRNRQIRRMLQVLGVQVVRLVRIAVGPLRLGPLPKGSCRSLAPAEKDAIDSALGLRTGTHANT